MNNSPVNNSVISSDASIKAAFISDIPVQVVAQWGEVTVYQTSAFMAGLEDSQNDTSELPSCKKMRSTECASYGKLNLGLHVKDNAKQVLTHRMQLLSAINQQLQAKQSSRQNSIDKIFPIQSLYWVNQVHGKQIYDVDASMLTMRALDADAMISQQSGIGLAIMTADCVPIVLYQPATQQIAAIHAGWQGLACGVIKATAERFDINLPIMAWIGVCISQAHYEVGSEVAEKLLVGCTDNQLLSAAKLNNFAELFCLTTNVDSDHNGNKKLKIDLPKLAMTQLKSLNISINNTLPIDCSYADNHYYSYRRQTHLRQSATGRMALIIVRHDLVES